MPIVATGVVVDAIAVANVEAVLGAIPPDRALHEPRKRRGKGRIELREHQCSRRAAQECWRTLPAGSIGPRKVIGAQALQDPGSVQEIMDQGVDGNERRADVEPQRPLLAAPK